jgi:enamine deaminase RidA (YjgF/YER057c/UK114 family)
VERGVINPWSWQDQFNFVQANEVSGAQRMLICAGQTSIDDEGNLLHPGDMRAQVAQSLTNLETVLEKAGFELSDVVRLNCYTTDVDGFCEAF